jgi:molybdopterin molybdotransferase
VLPEHAGGCEEGSIVEVASLTPGQSPRIDRGLF